MLFFNKKTSIAASGILAGATDYHSHILPGVDDGVETMDEALRILQEYERLGIKNLWLTPHIMEDIPNSPEKLTKHFEELKAAYTGNIKLHLAAEYMIDSHLHNLLNNSNCPSCVRGASNAVAEGDRAPLLPIGNEGNHLLVETSYFNPPMRFKETLKQIKSLGYHPLLAHPERYMYMNNSEYLELHENGIKFQLNIASLAGCYGKAAKKRAQWLLKKGMYAVAGSDLHCEHAFEYITECIISRKEANKQQSLLYNTIQ